MKPLELKNSLAEKLEANDGAGIIDLVCKAVSSRKISIESVYLDCLSPLMEETGAAWQDGSTPVWQEHLVSGLVRGAIESLAPEVNNHADQANRRIVLLACPPEEQHDIGLRMMADLYRLRGWTAIFLGADVPENQISAAALTLKADTVVISAATHFHRLQLRDLITNLKSSLPDTTILATGAAFRDEHEGWGDGEIVDPASLRAPRQGKA